MTSTLHEIIGRLEIIETVSESKNIVIETTQNKRQRVKGIKSNNE